MRNLGGTWSAPEFSVECRSGCSCDLEYIRIEHSFLSGAHERVDGLSVVAGERVVLNTQITRETGALNLLFRAQGLDRRDTCGASRRHQR